MKIFTFFRKIFIIFFFGFSFVPSINSANMLEIVAKTREVKQLVAEGQYDVALQIKLELISLIEEKFGKDHHYYGFQIADLGQLHLLLNNNDMAEFFLKQAEEIVEKKLGPEAIRLSDIKILIGNLYYSQGRYGEAKDNLTEAIEIDNKTLTENNSGRAVALSSLADIYISEANYEDAEELLYQALEAISLDADLEALQVLNVFMKLKIGIESIPEAINISAEIKNVFDNNYSNDPRIADQKIAWLINDAMLNFQIGNFGKAEELNKTALDLNIKLGDDGYYTSTIFNNLAVLYSSQGRVLEAEKFVEQSLIFSEKVYGEDHPDSFYGLTTLSVLKIDRGDFEGALGSAVKALNIAENFFGSKHPNVSHALNNLATIYTNIGNYNQGIKMYLRAIALDKQTFGESSPQLARKYNNLGTAYIELANYEKSYFYLEKALNIYEELYLDSNPDKIILASNLSYLGKVTGDEVNQLKFAKLAFDSLQERSSIPFHNELGFASEQRIYSYYYKQYIEALATNFDLNDTNEFNTAFSVAQMADYNPTASAIEKASRWLGKSEDEFSKGFKKRQVLIENVKRLDRRYTSLVSLNDRQKTPKQIKVILQEQHKAYAEIKKLEKQLSSSQYLGLDLIKPRIIDTLELQSLLKKNEAIIKYVSHYDKLYLFLITKSNSFCLALDVPAHELSEMVSELRLGLSLEGGGTREPFNALTSHVLYIDIFEPIEEYLESIQHIFLVPDGALESIPFTTLVTEEPNDLYYNLGDAIDLSWLAEDYSISTLPNVSALLTLRAQIGNSNATRSFLGVGDPLLLDKYGNERGITFIEQDDDLSVANSVELFGFTSLPETRDELDSIAYSLGPETSLLLLGKDASEDKIKNLKLTDFRVVAFATHGLIAGDLSGLSEPGLLLTPPSIESKENNGILTASEIAKLEFDADWIVLSACNTAASDGTPGAENLSGLARSFFFAGARRLFVSHWKVGSIAAKEITSRMFAELSQNPEVGRAEAHRRSIISLIKGGSDFNKHPSIWGPFSVVGDN